MNQFNRLRRALTEQGLHGLFYKGWLSLGDRAFDWRYGLDTSRWVTLDQVDVVGENRAAGNRYEPMRVGVIRTFLRRILPVLDGNIDLVDFGCGKGRILFVASEFPIHRATGIEFAVEIAALGRRNIEIFNERSGSTLPMEIITADATCYAIQPTQNLFLFYNPFQVELYGQVLQNIEASLRTHPRRIAVALFNSQYGNYTEMHSSLTPAMAVDHFGYRLHLYTNAAP